MRPSDWLWALFPFGFVAFWILVLNVLAVAGGWQRLARSYRTTDRPDGERFSFRSATIGHVNYNGCLNLVSTPKGLFLSVLLPFRPAHPALFVPWRDIDASSHRVWFVHSIDFAFAACPGVRVRFARPLAQALIVAAGQPVQFPAPAR